MLRCIFHKVVEIVHCCNLRSTRSPSVTGGESGNKNDERRITHPFSKCPSTKHQAPSRQDCAGSNEKSSPRGEERRREVFISHLSSDAGFTSYFTRYSRTVFGSRVRVDRSILSIERERESFPQARPQEPTQ